MFVCLFFFLWLVLQTTHTTHPSGLERYEFPSGQVEVHMPDGSREVAYPDGTKRLVRPDGSHEELLPLH